MGRDQLELLGFDLRSAPDNVTFGDASQAHTAPLVMLEWFGPIGTEEPGIECIAHTLPTQYGLDGLIGLNYLRRFKRVMFDFENGELVLDT